MGDPAQEVVDIWSISDIDGAVIDTRDTFLDLVTEEGVLEGMNMSGVSTMPWNKLMELVCSVRPRTK